MRELFYFLLVLILLFAMWKGIAFRVVVDGAPHIVEVGIGVMDDEETEEAETPQ